MRDGVATVFFTVCHRYDTILFVFIAGTLYFHLQIHNGTELRVYTFITFVSVYIYIYIALTLESPIKNVN